MFWLLGLEHARQALYSGAVSPVQEWKSEPKRTGFCCHSNGAFFAFPGFFFFFLSLYDVIIISLLVSVLRFFFTFLHYVFMFSHHENVLFPNIVHEFCSVKHTYQRYQNYYVNITSNNKSIKEN